MFKVLHMLRCFPTHTCLSSQNDDDNDSKSGLRALVTLWFQLVASEQINKHHSIPIQFLTPRTVSTPSLASAQTTVFCDGTFYGFPLVTMCPTLLRNRFNRVCNFTGNRKIYKVSSFHICRPAHMVKFQCSQEYISYDLI